MNEKEEDELSEEAILKDVTSRVYWWCTEQDVLYSTMIGILEMIQFQLLDDYNTEDEED